MRLKRAYRGDRLAELVPQEEKSIIRARTYLATDLLLVKFPCLCEEIKPGSLMMRPVRNVWPLTRGRVPAGSSIAPAWTPPKHKKDAERNQGKTDVP